MPTLATCTIVGHLTADPEPIPNQERAARFRAWVSETPRKGSEKVFTHFRCAVFGPQAEWLLRDGRKGMAVAFTGTFRLESYEKKDGTKGHSLEVRASDVRVLAPREDGEAHAPARPTRPAAAPQTNADGEPPF